MTEEYDSDPSWSQGGGIPEAKVNLHAGVR